MSEKLSQVYYVGCINPHTQEMLLSISVEDDHKAQLEKSTFKLLEKRFFFNIYKMDKISIGKLKI